MTIHPLKGQCLVEILPDAKASDGGIVIPDGVQVMDKGGKLPPVKGIVRRLGSWPQKPCGLAVLPEFAPGDTVLCSQYAGVKMRRHIGENFRMVRVEDVIAKMISCEE